MPEHRRGNGTLQRKVVACLAAARLPLAVADVRDRLGGRLAYNTVLTALARLHARGVLDRERDGRASVYSVPQDDPMLAPILIARRMTQLLDAEDDHSRVLGRFVADLGPDDRQFLAAHLRGLGSVTARRRRA